MKPVNFPPTKISSPSSSSRGLAGQLDGPLCFWSYLSWRPHPRDHPSFELHWGMAFDSRKKPLPRSIRGLSRINKYKHGRLRRASRLFLPQCHKAHNCGVSIHCLIMLGDWFHLDKGPVCLGEVYPCFLFLCVFQTSSREGKKVFFSNIERQFIVSLRAAGCVYKVMFWWLEWQE